MKLKDVIVCDDIRTEVANKYSLIGIYLDRITVQGRGTGIKYPFGMRLGLMIRLIVDGFIEFPQDFKIRYMIGQEEVLKVEGQVDAGEGSNKFVILPIIAGVPITRAGKLSFHLEFSQRGSQTYKFDNIYELDILESQPPSP